MHDAFLMYQTNVISIRFVSNCVPGRAKQKEKRPARGPVMQRQEKSVQYRRATPL
jgi:hypothetical protein